MKRGLNDKHKAFVEYYLQHFNGAKAAREAGFAERSARQTAHILLTDDDIKARIAERMRELTMQADEVLYRLSEHARGDIGEFLEKYSDDGIVAIDLFSEQAANKTRLIKRIRQHKRTNKDGQTNYTMEIELYDAQAALRSLGEAYRKFMGDSVNVTINGLEELLDKVYADE